MIKSYKPGPGTLTLGDVPLDVSAQVTSASVEPSENADAPTVVDVLSGEQLTDEGNVSLDFRLKATLLQDIAAAGVVDFSWINASDVVPFTLTPSAAAARSVEGFVRVVPLKVGGDVKVRATSDLDWQIIGTPTFGPA